MARSDRLIGFGLAVVLTAGAALVVSGLFGRGGGVESSTDAFAADALVVAASGGSTRVVVDSSDPSLVAEIDTAQVAAADGPVDSSGARDAAVAAVESMGRVVAAGRLGRRSLVAEFSTEGFFPVFIDATNASLQDLDVAASSGVSVSEWVLRSTVSVADDDRVVVRVWSLSVIEVDGDVRAMWRTVELVMRLVGEVWLVDGWESFDGPTPAPGASALFATGSEMRVVSDWERVG